MHLQGNLELMISQLEHLLKGILFIQADWEGDLRL